MWIRNMERPRSEHLGEPARCTRNQVNFFSVLFFFVFVFSFLVFWGMERDFLGLNSTVKEDWESITTVKEEVDDGSKDQGSRMQWAFSNKVSALPHLLSLKAVNEDRPKKIIFDHHSLGFQPIPVAFDSNQKPSAKTFNNERQAPQYLLPTYQAHDAHGISVSHEIRTFPVSSHSFSVAMTNPFLKIHGIYGATAGPNFAANSLKQQPTRGIPVTAQHSVVPVMGSVVETYGWRKISKAVAMPSQLTILYRGTVNVYDDISPEKAQEIMFLAGNGSLMAVNTLNLGAAQMQSVAPKHVVVDGIHGNQSHAASPCSALSSPMLITSQSATQSGGGSNTADDLMATKATAVLVPSSQSEPPKMENCNVSASTHLMPAAVPQARKASLTRFLEKRKERMMNTAPYTCKTSL